MEAHLARAIDSAPGGAWAVGVSGGADSVALLSLLRTRADLSLHVVHVNHETRGDESEEDARFVTELARQWDLPHTVARLSDLAPPWPTEHNPSARYRAARFELFRQVVIRHRLQGMLLAHHRDDQAETIFLRLLRGVGPAGLTGMSRCGRILGIRIFRPFLDVPRQVLCEYLVATGQAWREDASNLAPTYLRNRVRPLLARRPELKNELVALGTACRVWHDWLRDAAPILSESFRVEQLHDLPRPVARVALRRWLVSHGSDPDSLTPSAVERLLAMATDVATPTRQHFPSGLLVRRRGGILSVQSERE